MKNFFKISSLFLVFAFAILAFSGCEKKTNTTEWKTYKDETYGYQFKAPKDWKVEKGKGEQTGLVVLKDENDNQQMTISTTQKKENEKEFKGLCYQQNSEKCDKADHGTIQFNAGTGFVYDDSLTVEPTNRRFIILDNERLTFSLVNEDAGKERTIDQIISTISVEQQRREIDEAASIGEFLDGEYQFDGVDTSSWETYRNEEYGFKVKIPQGWGCDEAYNENGFLLTGVNRKFLVCLDNEDKEGYFKQQEDINNKRNEKAVFEYYEHFIFTFIDGYASSLTRLYAPNDLGINRWLFSTWSGIDNEKKQDRGMSIKKEFPVYLIKIGKGKSIFIKREDSFGTDLAHNYNFLSLGYFTNLYDEDFNEIESRKKLDGMLQSFEFIN